MAAGLEITGIDRLRARLKRAKENARKANRAATREAIKFLLKKSQEILDKEVYAKSRDAFDEKPDKSETDSLYKTFRRDLQHLSVTASEGKLVNFSDHAIFLEDGTDQEGTGSHFVPVGEKGYLAWMNGVTGELNFSQGHRVSGITPIRFLSRALTENRNDVVGIYRKHFKGIFK